jgi:hypothetical protein
MQHPVPRTRGSLMQIADRCSTTHALRRPRRPLRSLGTSRPCAPSHGAPSWGAAVAQRLRVVCPPSLFNWGRRRTSLSNTQHPLFDALHNNILMEVNKRCAREPSQAPRLQSHPTAGLSICWPTTAATRGRCAAPCTAASAKRRPASYSPTSSAPTRACCTRSSSNLAKTSQPGAPVTLRRGTSNSATQASSDHRATCGSCIFSIRSALIVDLIDASCLRYYSDSSPQSDAIAVHQRLRVRFVRGASSESDFSLVYSGPACSEPLT